MARVKIHWSKSVARLSNIANTTIDHLDENGFYTVSLGRKLESGNIGFSELLYIGQAYDQTIRERLLQPHTADNCINAWKDANPDFDLWVEAGVIAESDQQRITKELVDDAECCMIFSNKPECNTQCKENYDGRVITVNHENSWKLTDSSCP